jgi:hypothetical protein
MPLKLQILSTEAAKWQSFGELRLVDLSTHRAFLNSTRLLGVIYNGIIISYNQ